MKTNEMLDFVKALTHADRLRIIGALTRKPATLQEMVEQLEMPFKDAYNHLAFLAFVGVVNETNGVYKLDETKLEELNRIRFADAAPPADSPKPAAKSDAQKVLDSFLNPDGSIRQIPAKPAKVKVILEYLVQAFEPGVTYTEREVNEIIKRYNPDTASLRRYLVDAGMLERESDCSKYWRPAEGVRHA